MDAMSIVFDCIQLALRLIVIFPDDKWLVGIFTFWLSLSLFTDIYSVVENTFEVN